LPATSFFSPCPSKGWLVGVKFYEKPPTTQEGVVKPKTQRSTVLNYSGMLWMLEKPFAEEL
jgi:hypothetical protein